METGNYQPDPDSVYHLVPRIEWSACCKSMHIALQGGSDNECYGALCGMSYGKPGMGEYSLEPIKRCPWCGRPLEMHPNAVKLMNNYIRHQILPKGDGAESP